MPMQTVQPKEDWSSATYSSCRQIASFLGVDDSEQALKFRCEPRRLPTIAVLRIDRFSILPTKRSPGDDRELEQTVIVELANS